MSDRTPDERREYERQKKAAQRAKKREAEAVENSPVTHAELRDILGTFGDTLGTKIDAQIGAAIARASATFTNPGPPKGGPGVGGERDTERDRDNGTRDVPRPDLWERNWQRVDACGLCDDKGFILVANSDAPTVAICDHRNPPPPRADLA